MIDFVLKATGYTAIALLTLFFWVMTLGAVAIGIGVVLHATGVFTCGTIYCS